MTFFGGLPYVFVTTYGWWCTVQRWYWFDAFIMYRFSCDSTNRILMRTIRHDDTSNPQWYQNFRSNQQDNRSAKGLLHQRVSTPHYHGLTG